MAHDLGIVRASARGGKRPTGGSSKAGQQKDSSPIQVGNANTGGIGFANTTAFKTDAQIAAGNELSYEQAYGGSTKSGLALYGQMTESEREEYRVKSMGIAPTKTDDYSEWGISRKVAADEAHSKGDMSAQDKKDQLVIDARDASRYDWDVLRPQKKKEADARHRADTDPTKSGNRSTARTGKFTARDPAKRPASLGIRKSSGQRNGDFLSNKKSAPSGFRDPERYGGPMEQKIATLAQDGWTPEQVMDYGNNYMPFEALRTQNALPGVQSLTTAEAAAQYGGAGKQNAYSMSLISGTVMDPGFRNAMYGSGLGLEKTKTTLPYASGGQRGGGPGGLGNVMPILSDIQLGGKGY